SVSASDRHSHDRCDQPLQPSTLAIAPTRPGAGRNESSDGRRAHRRDAGSYKASRRLPNHLCIFERKPDKARSRDPEGTPISITQEYIEIRGARENNLKDVSLRLPKRKITIFTGVSGSGKSSVVFDTIANEAQRLLFENFSVFVRNFLPHY